MAAQSPGTILMSGGGLSRSGAKDPLCQAFNAAAEEWCKDHKAYEAAKKANGGKRPAAPPPPGKFNDRFYDKLTSQSPPPSFLSQMEREVPGLFRKGRRMGSGFGAIGQVAEGLPTRAGPIARGARTTARAMRTRMGNIATGLSAAQGSFGGLLVTAAGGPGGADRAFGRLRKYFVDRLSKRFYPRFFDGVLPGPPPRVLEIKGPTDGFTGKHGRLQAKDLAKLKPKPAVVSCKSCRSPSCVTTAGGGQRCK